MARLLCNITDAQITRLRYEAARAGDLMQAYICDRALGMEPRCPDTDVYAEQFCRAMDMRSWEARAECARVIAEAEAQEDGE